jgi:TRAP-type transport system periplasmic protein
LAFWENGFRHLTNNKRPIRKVEDGKGLKIRTMENKVHLAAWKAAGYNQTPMSWGEVYTALQQGVIDGQENPIAIISSNKLCVRPCKALILFNWRH